MNLFAIKRLNKYTHALYGKSVFTFEILKHEIEQMERQEFMINIPIGGAGSER